MRYDYQQAVIRINEILERYNNKGMKGYEFVCAEYGTAGYSDWITFGGICIYNSEIDSVYIEEENREYTQLEFENWILDKIRNMLKAFYDCLDGITFEEHDFCRTDD